MAINSKKYVDITTSYPSPAIQGRSFGGLVFTAEEPLQASYSSDTLTKKATDFNAGEIVQVSLDDITTIFGATSLLAKYANGYYGYVSPSGTIASALKIFKVTETGADAMLKAFKRAVDKTNMFGSFTFLSVPSSDDSTVDFNLSDDIEELRKVASYNATLDCKYLFVLNINKNNTSGNASDIVQQIVIGNTNDSASGNFVGIKGLCFMVGATDYAAYMPMAILGATNFTSGSVVNYMFKQFTGETPSVTTDADYITFNKNYVNFYGQTQSNGQDLAFFQRGFNMDGLDTSIYCNEMWFKAACETQLLTFLIGRERLPANPLGVDLVKSEVGTVCSRAVNNGMFMAKTVSSADLPKVRELVAAAGGDATDANRIVADVETIGYSIFAFLRSSQGLDENKFGPKEEPVIEYYVFYGTADSIRFIKGSDVMLK